MANTTPTPKKALKVWQRQLIEYAKAYASAGYAIVKLKGKKPISKDWQRTNHAPAEIIGPDVEKWLLISDSNNIGVILPPDRLAIDVDPRNFKNGVDSLEKLNEDSGLRLQDICTYKVRTGSGGWHLFFSKPTDIVLNHEIKGLYPGIEFKTKGRQVVMVGSKHPETGELYELTIDSLSLSHIVPVPQKIIDIAQVDPDVVAKRLSGSGAYKVNASAITDARVALQAMPPSIQGQGGDNQIYTAACLGHDYGIPPKAYMVLLKEYNKRSVPVWTDEELKTKLLNAYHYAQSTAGNRTAVADDFDEIEEEEQSFNDCSWAKELDRKKGKDGSSSTEIKTTFKNACILMSHMPMFSDSLGYNEFSHKMVFKKPLVWHRDYSVKKTYLPKGRAINDEDILQIKYYLAFNHGVEFPTNTLYEAVRTVTLQKKYHWVREKYEALKWDGVKRLDKFYHKYFGTEDTIYHTAVARKAFVAQVARIFEPGIKYDYMVILEGKQGIGKSTALQVMSMGAFADNIADFTNKDTLMNIHDGVSIVECAELEFTTKTEISAAKAFISRTSDRFRAPYDRVLQEIPRQNIFYGTVNHNMYLKDETGGRRFLPITCICIKLDMLRHDIAQLHAEAYHIYKQGTEKLYMDTTELNEWAAREQEARHQADVWEEAVINYLEEDLTADNYITSENIFCGALGFASINKVSRAEQLRLGAVMRKLGFEYKQKRIEGDKTRVFIKE